uniref:Cytidyltransferase-like domain-containing protein n=1 Tax=viral metagenome TaxID=1070528 RepID=A0A6C0CIZ0_9ZZZZ
MAKYKIGFTTGTFDLFHTGHVRLLKSAKMMCDYLIVAVTDDLLAIKQKRKPIIDIQNRMEVVGACKYVDLVIPHRGETKLEAYFKYKFDVCFIGDDWFNSEEYHQVEKDLSPYGVDMIYFPYSSNISTSDIIKSIQN